jgi:hypothetical protein
MKNLFKKILVSSLVIIFTFSPVLATPARAQWIDVSTMAKEYGLDALAFQIVNTIIKRISASTVNWINSGFQGKPAYVTNPDAYFLDIGDKVAGNFIFNNSDLNFLCGPISAKIKIALQRNYVQDNDRYRCTLTQVGQNMDNFMADFNNGGWDNFFEVSQRQQNNPIGAYMMAEGDLMQKIASKTNTATQELNQGNGFLSYKQCKAGAKRQTQDTNGLGNCDTDYNSCIKEWAGNDIGLQQCSDKFNSCNLKMSTVAVGDCADSDKETVTPGSVISNKLNSVLGQSEGRLQMADEINEMISALISQLTEKLVGAATQGLRGLSKPDSTGGGTFTNQLSTDNTSTDYFGNNPDTSVLNQPLPNPYTNPSSVIPTDRDCSSLDSTTLNSMAQNEATQSGMSLDQAMLNLDCYPQGIN